MIFITLLKWKQPPKKEMVEQSTEKLEGLAKQGVKMTVYWTLGRYDAVTIIEAPTEKDAMKTLLLFPRHSCNRNDDSCSKSRSNKITVNHKQFLFSFSKFSLRSKTVQLMNFS